MADYRVSNASISQNCAKRRRVTRSLAASEGFGVQEIDVIIAAAESKRKLFHRAKNFVQASIRSMDCVAAVAKSPFQISSDVFEMMMASLFNQKRPAKISLIHGCIIVTEVPKTTEHESIITAFESNVTRWNNKRMEPLQSTGKTTLKLNDTTMLEPDCSYVNKFSRKEIGTPRLPVIVVEVCKSEDFASMVEHATVYLQHGIKMVVTFKLAGTDNNASLCCLFTKLIEETGKARADKVISFGTALDKASIDEVLEHTGVCDSNFSGLERHGYGQLCDHDGMDMYQIIIPSTIIWAGTVVDDNISGGTYKGVEVKDLQLDLYSVNYLLDDV